MSKQTEINWDALRDIMRHEVTMWRNIAADFTAADQPLRMVARCDAKAEMAERVLEAMDSLEEHAAEKAGRPVITPPTVDEIFASIERSAQR